MSSTPLSNQTDITILAKLDTSNAVQLFLLDGPVVLNSANDQTVDDKFDSTTTDLSVSVTIVSTDDVLTVTNTNDSSTWSSGYLSSSTVKLYCATKSLSVPAAGTDPTTDGFTIKVGKHSGDPTVIISRGGAGNLALRTVSRPG